MNNNMDTLLNSVSLTVLSDYLPPISDMQMMAKLSTLEQNIIPQTVVSNYKGFSWKQDTSFDQQVKLHKIENALYIMSETEEGRDILAFIPETTQYAVATLEEFAAGWAHADINLILVSSNAPHLWESQGNLLETVAHENIHIYNGKKFKEVVKDQGLSQKDLFFGMMLDEVSARLMACQICIEAKENGLLEQADSQQLPVDILNQVVNFGYMQEFEQDVLSHENADPSIAGFSKTGIQLIGFYLNRYPSLKDPVLLGLIEDSFNTLDMSKKPVVIQGPHLGIAQKTAWQKNTRSGR